VHNGGKKKQKKEEKQTMREWRTRFLKLKNLSNNDKVFCFLFAYPENSLTFAIDKQ
jgi:hypothetical protein